MNQLNISTGGHAVFNEDILLIQNSMLDGFKALLQQIADTNGITCFIISGCTVSISVGVISITDGYICLDGEILKFTATSMAYNPSNYYYFDLQTIDGLPRAYYNAVTNSPQQERYAILSELTVPSGSLQDVLTAQKYEDLIQLISLNHITDIESAWAKLTTGFTIVPTYTGTGTYTITSTRIAYKVIGKTIHLMLSIIMDTTATTSTITQLDVTLPTAMGITFANFMPQATVMSWAASTGDEYAKCYVVNSSHKLILYRDQSTAYPAGTTLNIYGQLTCEIA
jgi:hypothetical protein